MTRARRLAGIPEPSVTPSEREEWDAGRVVDEIRARIKAGEPVAFSKVPLKLRLAGTRYFGSWQSAGSEAGLDCDAARLRRERYRKKEIVRALRRLARRSPRLTRTEFAHEHLPLFEAAIRRFRSLDTALKTARIRGWPIEEHEKWSKRRVIGELR